MTLPSSPVWFITGCSTGFGRELARLVLARGWRAVVTARDAARVADLAEGAEDRALALALDVTDQAQIDAAVAAAQERVRPHRRAREQRRLRLSGVVEEGEEAEIRAQFDANVFGLFALTRAVLPGMRAQRGGPRHQHHLGRRASSASRARAIMPRPSMRSRACRTRSPPRSAPLGIEVTCVEPGPFRTDWAGRSLQADAERDRRLCRDRGRADGQRPRRYSGTQAGDPVRAGEAMIARRRDREPAAPPRARRFGYDAVTAKLKERLAEIEAWREQALGADFPE